MFRKIYYIIYFLKVNDELLDNQKKNPSARKGFSKVKWIKEFYCSDPPVLGRLISTFALGVAAGAADPRSAGSP